MNEAASHSIQSGRVVALCGGVGGAKLALGLQRILGKDLTLIVNTGDDFEHYGLMISPDIDTVLYTLSGLADKDRGWGRAEESWNFMASLGILGGETWFQLGDKDLALHIVRTARLKAGETLTSFTASIAAKLGIPATILPMTDGAIRTMVETPNETLSFQRYFVEQRCAPEVRAIRFDGVPSFETTDEVSSALRSPDLRAIILCPSNPFLSIDPILATPGITECLDRADAPIIAISPIIAGAAVKGPTAKIMAELRVPVTPRAIADYYRNTIDALVIDEADAAQGLSADIPTKVTRTLMRSDEDRERLAREVLAFARDLAATKESP